MVSVVKELAQPLKKQRSYPKIKKATLLQDTTQLINYYSKASGTAY